MPNASNTEWAPNNHWLSERVFPEANLFCEIWGQKEGTCLEESSMCRLTVKTVATGQCGRTASFKSDTVFQHFLIKVQKIKHTVKGLLQRNTNKLLFHLKSSKVPQPLIYLSPEQENKKLEVVEK